MTYLKNYFIRKTFLVGFCLLVGISPLQSAMAAVEQKTVEELFYHAMLAQASYEYFNEGDAKPGDLESSLKANKKNFMNEKKRDLLIENFDLLNHTQDAFLTGFSASIFKNKNTNEINFASRGSAGVLDFLVADGFGIAVTGVPQDQVIDLYNYVQRLKTPKNGTYNYVKRTPFRDYKLFFGKASDGADHEDWFTSNNVNGAGHSLGGNLTAAFGRLFNDYAKDSYTINSAGTAGPLASFFAARNPLIMDENEFYQQIGGANTYQGNYNSISDMYSEDGIEMTTSDATFTQLGGNNRIPVNIEFPGNVASHFGEYIVDSLGVAWSFSQLDPSFDLTKHSALMDAAHVDESQHLDTLINGMHEILTENSTNVERWDGIVNIGKSGYAGNVEVLAGLSPSSILSYYNQSSITQKSMIFSALKGLPFGFPAAYADINPGDYSSMAVKDLSGMLATELYYNVKNFGFNPANTINPIIGILGIDDTTYTKPNGVQIRNVVGSKTVNVFFGTSNVDTPTATDQEDRIYSLDGDDTLTGLAGNDHLEGGPGIDTLNGGDGNDTLLGGKGDDTLDGEKGSDILDGGDGNDTYIFTKDSGNDQIFNIENDKSDDTGIIKYEGQVVDGSGAKRKSVNANAYYDKDSEILYLLYDGLLTIQFEDNGVVQSVVNIPKFTNGNLGINLPTEIDSLADTTTRTLSVSSSFVGTCANASSQNGEMIWLYSWDKVSTGDSCNRERIDSPQIITNDTANSGFILASGEDDRIIGNDQKEYLHGGLGADYIKAGGGDDLINGDFTLFGLGLVLNTPIGNIGNDWVEAGAGNDKIFGDNVFTRIPAAGDSASTYDYGNQSFQDFHTTYDPETQNDTLIGDDGDDEIYGNLGSDYLLGGNGADIIYGGAHGDRIEGGEGDDFIYADADILIWMSIQQDGSNAYQNDTYVDEIKDAGGDDVVSGGAGNDYIATGTGDDTIYGGDGDDLIYADGSLNEVDTTIDVEDDIKYNGKDLVFGGDGVDNIWGFGNDDILHGDAGNDLIWGDHNDLDDALHGDDIIYGGAGDDQLNGQAGNDKLFGDDGNDLLSGGKGNDRLEGGKGDDELQGKEGNDRLFGGEGIDNLFGDEGKDYLAGGAGDDQLVAGDGDDILIGGTGTDYLYGGEGNDRLSGGADDDVLQGDSGDDILAGGRGSDTLRGGIGNDSYVANFGDGQSKIDDSIGANQIRFGAGISFSSISVVVNDTGVFLDYASGDSVFIESASMGGSWTVNFANGANVSLSYLIKEHTPKPTTITQIPLAAGVTAEQLSFMRSNNSLLINYLPSVGSSLGLTTNQLSLKSSNNVVKSSTNWVDATVLSDAGYIFSMNTVVIDNQQYEQLSLTNWYNADPTSYLNQLNLGTDVIDLTSLDSIASNFSGSNYADEITASEGNDTIYGYSAADTIDAKAGNDVITAGTGNDQIAGGVGDDQYYFSAGDGQDILFDEDGVDTIIFSEGISASDLTVEEKPNGLLIRINTIDENGNAIKDVIFILSWFQIDNAKIETFQFYDNNLLTSDDIEQMIVGNRSPIANLSLQNQTAILGRPFSFTLPSNLFSDPDGDIIEIRAFNSSGGVLNSWLSFDQTSQVFSGTPNINDAALLSISVVAADTQSYTKVVNFNVNVDSSNGFPGTVGADVLVGGAGDDFLSALSGDDSLNGQSGDDRLVGGTGNDTLQGGYGNDTFVFGLGDGVDTIITPSNDNFQFGETDTIEFADGILPQDVQLLRDPTQAMRLLINYGAQNDQIRVENFFSPTALRNPIDRLTFSNGVIWDSEYMRQVIEHIIDANDNDIYVVKDQDSVDVLAGNDYVAGGIGNDNLTGGLGNDQLLGNSGDDILNGGKGNDVVVGGDGNNKLLFSNGDGVDHLPLTAINGVDVLQLDSTISSSSLSYYRFGDALVIGTNDWFSSLSNSEMPSNTEHFIIAERFNGLYGFNSTINSRLTIELSDQSIIDLTSVTLDGVYLDLKYQSNIDNYLSSWNTNYGHIRVSNKTNFDYEFEGSSDNDVIFGSSDNDYITPSSGVDLIYSGAGNDEIRLGSGSNYLFAESGNDVVYDSFGIDHIDGGSGDDIFNIERNTALHFNLGAGNDIVNGNDYGTDNLSFYFPDSLTESSFIFSLIDSQTDLVVSWGSAGDSITFVNWVNVTDTGFQLTKAIEINFAQTQWSQSEIKNRLLAAVNFAPVANDDNGLSTEQGVTLNIASTDLTANDTDLNGDYLSIVNVFAAQGGSVVIDQASGIISFTPDAGYSGSAGFTYIVSDGELETQANVAITINGAQGGGNSGGQNGTPPDPSDYTNVVNGTESAEQLYYSNQDDYISGLGGDDQLFGLSGNDYLDGGAGNDYLDGGAGNDIQFGGDGDDQLGGDAGNDLLIGGSGNDTYVFRPGNGQDSIDNSIGDDGVDWLIFTDDITSNRLIYTRIGNDLVITILNSTDQLTILNWFLSPEYQIDYIQPSGSTAFPASSIDALLTDAIDPGDQGGGGSDNPVGGWSEPDKANYSNSMAGTENAEQIYIGNGSDFLEGLGGDDQLFGVAGNDYLSGGLGNDYLDGGDDDDIQYGGDGDDQLGGDSGNDLLIGGGGNDIYVYGSGDGLDTIDNSVGDDGIDWLIFTDSLTADKLIYSQVNNDLLIKVTNSSEQVTIKNWFLGGIYQLDYIQPSGGGGIPATQIGSLIVQSQQ